jgi:hypothetical protein
MSKRIRTTKIAGAVAKLLALTVASGALAQTAGPPVSLAAFVRADYYHGINYSAAHAYGPQAVPELLMMLGREEEREHWSNILSVLGMIGDPRATEPMIEFLERRFSGEVDPVTYGALLQVTPSLGFLAHDTTGRAFSYLREGTSIEAWRKRNLAWTFPALRGGDREILMVKLDIHGLGISGTEAGRAHLRTLQGSLGVDRDGLWNFIKRDVAEALRVSEHIRRTGYEGL